MPLNISPRNVTSVITDDFPKVPKKNQIYWVGDKVAIGGVVVPQPILSYDRPPDQSDNSSKGYTINSVWQHGGNIYQPAVAPDATAGYWRTMPNSGGLPGDVLGAAAQCVGGMIALKTGFTGPAVRLTSTVAASPVNTDINILAGGRIDENAIQAVIAAADTGTYVYVTTIYDQSGAGNHCVFSVVANLPLAMYVVWDELLGCYTIGADQSLQTSFNQGIQFPATLSVAESAFTALFFGRGLTSSSTNEAMIASFGSSTNVFAIDVQEDAVGPTVAMWSGSSRVPDPSGTAWAPLDCRPCVVSVVGTTTNLTIGCNENSYVKTLTTVTTARTGGFLGAWNLNNNGRGPGMRYLGFAIGNAAASAAQIRRVKNWFYSKFNVKPQTRNRFVLVTDSRGGQILNTANAITKGVAGTNLGMLIAEALKSDTEVINAQRGSSTNAIHASITVPGLVKMVKTGGKNVAAVMLGINDFLVLSLTPAQSVAALAANVSALKAGGYTVLVIAELATTSTTGSASTNLPLLRARINAGESGADHVIDVSDITAVVTPSNATFYPDGVHETECVARPIASRIAAVVDEIMSS